MANQFNNFNDQNQNRFSAVNKKKLLFIGGALLVLLLIAGAAYYYLYYQKPSAPTAPIFPSVENETNPFTDIVAGKKSVSTDCSNETNQTAKDACFQSKAVTEKNAVFCKSIKESTHFVSKDACLNLVAHEKKDRLLCASIQDPSIKKNCEKTIK